MIIIYYQWSPVTQSFMNVLFTPVGYVKSNSATAFHRDRILTTHICTVLSWLHLCFFSESVKDIVYIQCIECIRLQLNVKHLFCLDIKPFFRRPLWRERGMSFVESNTLYTFTDCFVYVLYMFACFNLFQECTVYRLEWGK